MYYHKRTLGIPGVLHIWSVTPREAFKLLGRLAFGDWTPHWAREEIDLIIRGVLAGIKGRPPKKWQGYSVDLIGKDRLRITRYFPDQKNRGPEGPRKITGSVAITQSAPEHSSPDDEL